MTTKTKYPRRVHSSIDTLPGELQAIIQRMIVNFIWPSDYKGRHSGTPRYNNVVRYCREKGFIISHSAIGRFAKRIRAESAQKTINELTPYTLAHLAEICREFTGISDDLLESTIHPERSPMMAERKAFLEKLAFEEIGYIENTIRTLRIVGYK